MPVDPGNLMLMARARRGAGAGPAGLRALAQGQRLRLGAAAVARRPAGRRRMRSGAWASAGCWRRFRSRPLPRARAGGHRKPSAASAPRAPRIAALILAAGRSTPHGHDQQAADRRSTASRWCATPPRRCCAAQAAAGRRRHRPSARARSRTRSRTCRLTFVHNPDFAQGLSTSLKVGLAAAAGRYRRRRWSRSATCRGSPRPRSTSS